MIERVVTRIEMPSFFKQPELRGILKQLRPDLPKKIPCPVKVEPRTNRYMLVGTAFDYLLRFEILRRAPRSQSERWVAEHAPDILWRETEKGHMGLMLDWQNEPESFASNLELRECAQRLIDHAKLALVDYARDRSPKECSVREMAGHAIRMAKLDSLLRSMRLAVDFEVASSDDVDDLVAMLDIVPFENLLGGGRVLLNPVFDDASELVGGADVDLISGDMIVDIKTTKKPVVEAEQLDQLLGYFLLARKQTELDPTFPDIKRVGLYFSRHGHLLCFATTEWTSQPHFLELEERFFSTAKRLFET